MTASSASVSTLTGYQLTFPFESSFDVEGHRKWFNENWTICFKISAGYLMMVYFATMYMKNRKPLELRLPLIIWSAALSLFSLYGASRVVPELFQTLRTSGLGASTCDNKFLGDFRVEFCMFLFAWSKVIELADTAFIVLRGKKLIFLHWFHHATALLYAWYGYVDMGKPSSPYRWMAAMNYSVHFVMYGYYALSAARIRVPRVLAQSITSLQILQMVVAVALCASVLVLKATGTNCDVTMPGLWYGLALYGTYMVLFGQFFIKTYFGGKDTEKKIA